MWFKRKCLSIWPLSGGSIRIRLLHFSTNPPDANFYGNKFKNALNLRQGVNINKNGKTNCFRLINGEGDGLSGLIIDIYGETAVVQCHSTGIHKDKQQIIKAFEALDGLTIKNIYDKSEETLYKNEGIQEKMAIGRVAWMKKVKY